MIKERYKNLLINFCILISVSLLLLAIGEFLVRSLYKENTVLFPRFHTDAHYGEFTLRKIRPNSEFWHSSVDGQWKFFINGKGLRNYRDFPYEKPSQTFRVLSLGDSHTQGFEVRQDYTFSAIIEKYLQRQGLRIEVINAGISGFSTAEELVFLENEGILYSPDFVVLGFYANDFEDNLKAALFRLEDGTLVVNKRSHVPGVSIQNLIYRLPFVKRMSENSYLYSLAFNATWNFFKTRLTTKAYNEVMEFAIPTQEQFTEKETALTIALIKRLYEFCQEKRIKLIILDIPKIRGKSDIGTSIPVSLIPTIEKYSDAYVNSVTVLENYRGLADFHRPHGHRHISEFTHTLLGVETGKKIIRLVRELY